MECNYWSPYQHPDGLNIATNHYFAWMNAVNQYDSPQGYHLGLTLNKTHVIQKTFQRRRRNHRLCQDHNNIHEYCETPCRRLSPASHEECQQKGRGPWEKWMLLIMFISMNVMPMSLITMSIISHLLPNVVGELEREQEEMVPSSTWHENGWGKERGGERRKWR